MKKSCYIVGGGPSLQNFDWSLLHDKDVIAINRAYEVLPNAKYVYFTDQDFWLAHKDKITQHTGQLIRGTLRLGKTNHPKVEEYKLTGQKGIDTSPKCLRHGSNSTYAAINLALFHLNYDIVYLLGVDMKWSNNKTHWHDGHKRVDPETVYKIMMGCLESLSKDMLVHPSKQIINVNDDSALTCFDTQSISEHFAPQHLQ